MPLLKTVLPEFAEELAEVLDRAGHEKLAVAVAAARIEDRCRCDQKGCATFFAVPKAEAPPGIDCDRLIPDMGGVSCIQFHKEQLIWVEALDRPHDRLLLVDFEKKHGIIGNAETN